MSADIFRKYVDIINENSQPNVRLDEGIMGDAVKKAANWLAGKFGVDLQQIANITKQATGGDATPNTQNGAKVMQALGITPQDVDGLMKKAEVGEPTKQVAESFLNEATGKQIALRIVWAILSAGFINMMIKSGLGWNLGAEFSHLEGIWALVGGIVLMASSAFWDDVK
jgi:hypothetical protein